MQLTVGPGLWPALYGLVLGLAGGAGVVRLIQSTLYETKPLAPGSLRLWLPCRGWRRRLPVRFRDGGHPGSIRGRLANGIAYYAVL